MPEMDYSKLLGRIREKGYTQKSVAKEVGISESQFSMKLGNVYPFKQNDIQKLCDCLGIEAQEIGGYFFTQKLEKSQVEEPEGLGEKTSDATGIVSDEMPA